MLLRYNPGCVRLARSCGKLIQCQENPPFEDLLSQIDRDVCDACCRAQFLKNGEADIPEVAKFHSQRLCDPAEALAKRFSGKSISSSQRLRRVRQNRGIFTASRTYFCLPTPSSDVCGIQDLILAKFPGRPRSRYSRPLTDTIQQVLLSESGMTFFLTKKSAFSGRQNSRDGR